MDLSDVAVRHAVTFGSLDIRHSIELSPSFVSVAREARFCLVAVVIGFAAVSIVKTVLDSSKAPPR